MALALFWFMGLATIIIDSADEASYAQAVRRLLLFSGMRKSNGERHGT